MNDSTLAEMPSYAVEQYLDELRLLRKPMTVVSAEQILEEYLPFADPSDLRGGVLRWLRWCKDKGNSTRTLEAKRTRVQCFYKRLDINLRIPRIRFTPPRPEIYTADELDRLFKVASGRRHWLFKTFMMSGLRKQEMELIQVLGQFDWGDHGHGRRPRQ